MTGCILDKTIRTNKLTVKLTKPKPFDILHLMSLSSSAIKHFNMLFNPTPFKKIQLIFTLALDKSNNVTIIK